jgi:hypothetical protein
MAKKEEVEVKAGEEGTKDAGVKFTEKPAEKKKTIEVDEGILRELIESNKLLQQTVDQLGSNAVATANNGIQVRRKTREYDYTLRKWDGKIVLGYENMGTDKRPLYVYNIYDSALRQNVQFVNLLLLGEKEPVKQVDYITFLRDAERVKARKISQVEHEDVKEYGMIPKKEMAENGYGMFETMVMVPVEVTSKTYTVTLKLPEDEGGGEVVVNSEWLNM